MNDTTNYGDKHEQPHHPKAVRVTLDGRDLTFKNRSQSASAILVRGGLDPVGYDLAEIHHGHDPHVYADSDVVHLKDGQAFVSIRQSAEVA